MLAAAPFDGVLSDPEPPIIGTEGARYVRRVGVDLALWATPDGSGAPYAMFPLGIELKVGTTDGDDVVTIDMAGGDIPLDGLTIVSSGGDDRVRLVNGEDRLLTIDGLPVLNGKKLDLGVADLRITGTSVAAVETLIATARNTGPVRWQGPGIGTTAAAAAAAHRAVGLAPVAQGSDTLVKYTYNGDANGDGKINADDYFMIDQGFPEDLKRGYAKGDFNFDGRINADDYFEIDLAFLMQGAPLAAAAAATSDAAASLDNDAARLYRYLKRVGDELHAWSTFDGSGTPTAIHSLPLAGNLTLDSTASGDVIVIDMSGGDIDVLGTLGLVGSAGDDVICVVNGDGRVLTVGAVALSDKKLDLGTAGLKIRDADIYAVEELVGSARRGPTRWTGPGIGTSSAGAYTGLVPLRRGSDVVVEYGWNGDMNGDGRLNADDYFRIDRGFLAQPSKPLYEQGDLNFDDKIDADDYWIIDQAFLPPFEPPPPL